MRMFFLKFFPLLIILFLCFTTPSIATAQNQEQDRVDVMLINQSGNPIQDVTITLLIYKFDENGTTVEIFPSGSCTTGPDGRCEIIVSADAPKDPSGFLKGALDLGERGKRSVIWPGGLLEVSIKLNQSGKIQTDIEAGPFDHDQPAELTITQPRPQIYGVGILLAAIFLGLAFALYWRARKTS